MKNSLFVAWRPETTPDGLGWRPIGRLEHDGIYRFWYTKGARKPGFQPLPGMDNLDEVYESDSLFPLFANRLLPKSRPEYDAYLRWSGFDSHSKPDPILVLGVTEGLRQTDAIEVFPCPTPDADGCYIAQFFLHGIRWMPKTAADRVNALEVGAPLKLMLDLQNAHDPQAVAVRTDAERMIIGYVPRYMARDTWQILFQCDPEIVELEVARINRDAPLQNRVLCRMRACWPDDFRPCSDEDFEPIPTAAPSQC
jgi:hypothetical protein